MHNPYKSRDWRIRVRCEWILRDDVIRTIKCERCNGHGSFGSWGGDPDDDNTCNTCMGRGEVPNPEIEPRPVMPEVFINYMRGYFNKFFDMMDERATRLEKQAGECDVDNRDGL